MQLPYFVCCGQLSCIIATFCFNILHQLRVRGVFCLFLDLDSSMADQSRYETLMKNKGAQTTNTCMLYIRTYIDTIIH